MGLYTDPNYLERKSGKIRRIIFHIAAVLAAFVTYAVVFLIVYSGLSILGSIPLLRSILFAPGDVFWTRIGLSPLIAGLAASTVSAIISGTARPAMLLGIIWYAFATVLTVFSRSISGVILVQDITSVLIFIWLFRKSPTLKDAKIAMMTREMGK